MNTAQVGLWLLCLCSSVALEAQWPQWRGPDRNGTVAATGTPKWPAAWKRAWRVDVGEGYSSPVVAGGRAFVHSRRDPDEIVTAIDLATGKVAWQQKYATPFNKNQYAAAVAKGPHATPLVIGDKVFTFGAMAVLTAWNTQTGAVAWRKDYSASVDTSKLFTGTSASPLSEGGAVIVQVGSDVHGGRILALDPATGAEKWTWTGKGPGYASPVVDHRRRRTPDRDHDERVDRRARREDGRGALVRALPRRMAREHRHANLDRHPLDRVGHRARERMPTRSPGAAGKWQATEAWKNADVAMYMSTPVLADGIVYGLSNKKKGQVVAVDAATGALKWATEGRAADQAAILLTPAHVLVLTTGGELVLVKRSAAKYDEERRYTVADSATWAVPVVLPDGLIVRDATGVLRLTAGS